LSLIERRAEFFEGLVVSRLREVVNSNGQGFCIQVRQKISFGVEDLPGQSARIVGTRQVFPEQRNQTGLGSIGNHFDGIDEVLALGAQAREAFLLG
jgi:hypothetical protein